MSARTRRTRFATPFVMTLAACGGPTHTANPAPPRPPPADDRPVVAEPADPSAATENQTPPTPEGPHSNPPGPTPHKNPPPPEPVPVDVKPEPAKYERRWTVMKIKGNADCQAILDSSCPKVAPGQPIPPCNPPPPLKYACPTDLADGATMKIILRVGATDCFVDLPPIKCKPNATCNPPPPRKLACPK